MLNKIYLEITNVCNFDCTFCHKTSRKKKLMSEDEFEILTDKLQGKAKYLYFHLMGEPTLHPLLPKFIDRAKKKGFLPTITTNGSLLGDKQCGFDSPSYFGKCFKEATGYTPTEYRSHLGS